MINFQKDNSKFNYRISGILYREGKILFHKFIEGKSWMLPGGRAEFLENSIETLKREFQEELNCEVEVKKLRYVVENFFEYNNLDYHELEFIHLVELKEGNIPFEDFIIEEFGVEYVFKWLSLEEMENTSIKPLCLIQPLETLLELNTQHYIQVSN